MWMYDQKQCFPSLVLTRVHRLLFFPSQHLSHLPPVSPTGRYPTRVGPVLSCSLPPPLLGQGLAHGRYSFNDCRTNRRSYDKERCSLGEAAEMAPAGLAPSVEGS